MGNQIFTIAPYAWQGMWVFDDAERDVLREPFVGGVPTIINVFLAQHGLAGADRFVCQFSADPFPGVQLVLQHVGADQGGEVYRVEVLGEVLQGWFCPCLYKYFPEAPDLIFVRLMPSPDAQPLDDQHRPTDNWTHDLPDEEKPGVGHGSKDGDGRYYAALEGARI
jgi:hypothetical protein